MDQYKWGGTTVYDYVNEIFSDVSALRSVATANANDIATLQTDHVTVESFNEVLSRLSTLETTVSKLSQIDNIFTTNTTVPSKSSGNSVTITLKSGYYFSTYKLYIIERGGSYAIINQLYKSGASVHVIHNFLSQYNNERFYQVGMTITGVSDTQWKLSNNQMVIFYSDNTWTYSNSYTGQVVDNIWGVKANN